LRGADTNAEYHHRHKKKSIKYAGNSDDNDNAGSTATAEAMPFHFCFVHFVRGARTIVKFVFPSHPSIHMGTLPYYDSNMAHRQSHTRTHTQPNDNGSPALHIAIRYF